MKMVYMQSSLSFAEALKFVFFLRVWLAGNSGLGREVGARGVTGRIGSVIPYYLQMTTMPLFNPTRSILPRAHFSA